MSRTTEILLDDDVFDESFLKELDQLEEFATSTTQHHKQHQQPPPPPPSFSNATSSYAPPPPKPPPPQPRHYFPLPATSETVDNISYSPPRELSQPQRFTNNNTNTTSNCSNFSTSTRSSRSPVTPPPPPEIDFLKSELSRVSKQLSDLKDECSVLRKERDKERLKFVQCNAKSSTCDFEAPLVDHPKSGISVRCENVTATTGSAATEIKTKQKSIGMQTDRGDESASASISGTTSSLSRLPKLLTILSSRSGHSFQRKFAAKLLETCASDFCALFGCLGLNMTKETVQGLTHVPLPANIIGPHSTEVTRISRLYSVLNELCIDIVHINAFLRSLLDLCELENAFVVCRSLRILRVAVHYLLSAERTLSRRDNVQVEKSHSGSDERNRDSNMGKSEIGDDISGDEASNLSFAAACEKLSTSDHETISLHSQIDWFHLFASICEIAVKLPEGHAKVEAVFVMNIILRGMHPYLERGKFGERCVYESVAELLKKEAGLFCQKEAVDLLYLLLNCPNILATFCSSCKSIEGCTLNDGASSFSQASRAILEGIADCILCSGHSVEELSLSRNAVVVLAFLASSGKCGLEIFLYHKLSKAVNFLGLILRVLVSEIDAESLGSCPTPNIFRERTLLMREALILLNRLVSHPAYAATVLQVLGSCKEIVSLAIDSASRLSKKTHRLLKSDSITQQMRKCEVVDLASSFKKRIFTFLGESS